MNREPILIRVDGTPCAGWEHLSRCLTLALALQRRRRPTYFLSQLEPVTLAVNIKRSGHDWLNAPYPAGSPEDLKDTVRQIRRLRAAAILVDVPHVTEDYLAELRSTGTTVVSVDNLSNIRFPSKLVINPLLGPGKENYEFTPGTQLLVGSRFALVRSEMRRLRALRSQEPPQPFRALVALGDDDRNWQSGEMAKLLLNAPRIGRVDVVVRPQHLHLEELRALAATLPERLTVVTEPAEIASRVMRCHVAITAGDSWSLELACVGIPQLIIVQSEAHWPSAQRLEEEGAASCLGWHANVSANTIRQAIQNVLTDPLERKTMSRCGRKLIDGRGPDRLVTGLEIMLHRNREVELERAA